MEFLKYRAESGGGAGAAKAHEIIAIYLIKSILLVHNLLREGRRRADLVMTFKPLNGAIAVALRSIGVELSEAPTRSYGNKLISA